jgi:cytochrome c oxidase cbb3-type subunit III
MDYIRALLSVSALAATVLSSNPARPNSTGQPATGASKPAAVAGPDFPRPPADPASIARGKQTFGVNCGFCHGSGARGGEGGPNLLRSPIVLNDRSGELVAAIVLNGRADKGMPKFNLPMDRISDIAAYLHSIDIGADASPDYNPRSVLVGNAAAGKAYFESHCTACHSVTKDLAGIGSKYDPPHLQDAIFTAGGTGIFGEPSPTAPRPAVKIEMPSGALIEGRLVEMDDFAVVLIDDRGDRRTIRRDGDVPRIHIDNPLQAHLDMVRRWEDRDLHDLTAYLATLK